MYQIFSQYFKGLKDDVFVLSIITCNFQNQSRQQQISNDCTHILKIHDLEICHIK